MFILFPFLAIDVTSYAYNGTVAKWQILQKIIFDFKRFFCPQGCGKTILQQRHY